MNSLPVTVLYSDVSVRQVKLPLKCDVEAVVALRHRAGRIDAARLRRENHVTSLMSNVIDRHVTLPLHEQGGVEVPDATDDVDLVTRDGWPFHNRAPVQPHLPPGRPDP